MFTAWYIGDLNSSGDPAQFLPFHTYAEDGTGCRENITGWALDQFRSHYHDKRIGKRAIFHYVYGLLHPPVTARGLPTIANANCPASPSPRLLGLRQSRQSAGYPPPRLRETRTLWPPVRRDSRRAPLLPRRRQDAPLQSKAELTINKSLTLAGIPCEVLGYRSALEWVIDQYQVTTDARGGITSDPNREDDPNTSSASSARSSASASKP